MSERRYLTVTALTRYIKTKLENDPHLHTVFLKGEISNFKHHGRGHMYFTLKDENARIPAVMFAGHNKALKFIPENGMKVLVQGEISLYEPSGAYQIYVKAMDADGVGNLYLAYEQLKKKLDAEGLFSSLYKKTIPTYPKKIAVATSPTGAAVKDIITTIERRYPIAQVIVLPTLVQGEHAAPSVVRSIEIANTMGDIDTLIVGRGGGSIEELWAFNEEIVARAIFASSVPIISAVGHETDTTIADFVSDLRAPTPTAAAELAVPNREDLIERVNERMARLHRGTKGRLEESKSRLSKLENAYAFRYPRQMYIQKEQQLDRLMEQLKQRTEQVLVRKQHTLLQTISKLQKFHPKERIEGTSRNHKYLTDNLQKAMCIQLQKHQSAFQTTLAKLEASSPLKIMERGYSLVYDEQDKLVKSVTKIQLGDTLTIQLGDGKVETSVMKKIGERG